MGIQVQKQKYLLTALLAAAGLALSASGQVAPPDPPLRFAPTDSATLQEVLLRDIRRSVDLTDEEWAVIKPKVVKVLALELDTGTGEIGVSSRNLGGRRGSGSIARTYSRILHNGQPSAVDTKAQELQAVVDNPQATPLELRVKLEEYRAAVQKARDQLVIAERELLSVLTVRQEAVLVDLGVVE
jgi:hypothetical protein